MIRFIKGKLAGKSDKGIIVFIGGVLGGQPGTDHSCGVGYEVEVPVSTRRVLSGKREGEVVDLHISYQQSQNQPVPRLYGFHRELERDFFEELIRVSNVGPSVALSAMSVPVRQIAKAIVDRDVKTLKSLKHVGPKMAEKIIAELSDRVAKYALLSDDATTAPETPTDFKTEARDTLVKQLGFKPQEAQKAIEEAMKRNSKITSPEELFDEVLRGHK